LTFQAASRQLPVEHRHPVAHIVECDAQLGLALADLVEQPGIVHRNRRRRREVLEQRDLFLGEWSHFLPSGGDDPKKLALWTQRNAQQRTRCCIVGVADEREVVPRHVKDMREWFALDQRLGAFCGPSSGPTFEGDHTVIDAGHHRLSFGRSA